MANYHKKRKLTDKLFSSAHQDQLALKITGQMESRHMPGLSKNDDGTVKVVPCINLDTGEEGLYLVNTIVERILDGEPAGGVGMCYLVENVGMHDKGYRILEVSEIDDPTDDKLDLFDA